ncbi:MAG: arginine--tRNA ligase, partial [Ruminococcus sp.]
MSLTSINAVKDLRNAINTAFEKAMEKELLPKADIPQFIIEAPANRQNGDLATNAAMLGARTFRMPPMKIADALKSSIDLEGTLFDRCEAAGAGFLNFFLKPEYFAKIIEEIEESGDSYGRSNHGEGKKYMVEFVSANPTGPMHMGNARGGALGDCLASVLDAAGYDVYREFYVNDAGNQIEKFANSLEARYLQIFDSSVPFPEDGYQGGDIKDLAEA